MIKALTILKILFVIAAIVCFGLCIFRESARSKTFLMLGLTFNAAAFLIHFIMTERA